jgi:phosphoglycerate dehydrogenase-like enzyme
MNAAPRPFRVALTADFHGPGGSPRYRDLGLEVLAEEPRVEVTRFAEHRPEIGADQVAGAHGVIVLTPRVTAGSVAGAGDLLAIGRFGVGVDTVDVPACTTAEVLVFIAAGAVDRSVAEATLAWMLALTHHVRAKDALVRGGRWDERSAFMGAELRDRTLGVIGLGGIGRALIALAAGFGMRPPLACDPHVDPAVASRLGVQVVSLDELLRSADFVSIHCPLNDETRNLIGRRELGLMKPGAYLLNTARGGIVDEDALHEALSRRRIAGAAVDVFAREPLSAPPRLAELDNVLLAPHSIAWTDELFRDIGRTVCRGMVALARGERPDGVVNPEVFTRPGFRQKWARLTAG